MSMKIALPVHMAYISPLFDVAEQLMVLEEKEAPASAQVLSLGDVSGMARVQRVTVLQVDTLICGAISRPMEMMLQAAGVRVLARHCGAIEEVLQAYRENRLDNPEFIMPGCCRGGGGRCGSGGGMGGGWRRGGGGGRRRGGQGFGSGMGGGGAVG